VSKAKPVPEWAIVETQSLGLPSCPAIDVAAALAAAYARGREDAAERMIANVEHIRSILTPVHVKPCGDTPEAVASCRDGMAVEIQSAVEHIDAVLTKWAAIRAGS